MIACLLSVQVSSGLAQFSIGPGGWVTVKSGGSMMIGADVHIKSVAGASGYLVDQNAGGSITITGDVTVDRYMTPDVWHNTSSPVSNESSDVYAGTDLVFWYNEALILNDWNFGWVWYSGATGGPLAVFRGYDVYFATSPFTINYQATGTESLNTGPYSITVINTASTPSEIPSHKGWNLLGNPYPSPVDWLAAAGWDKSDINDAKYIWDGANSIYTIYLGGGAPIGINGGTRFIPSNQGFWVQSIVASGTVGINNATRVGDISGTPDFYKEEPVDYPMISLVAEEGRYSDEVVVRFIPGTTGGFDLNWDATKLLSIDADVPHLILRSGERSYALNTLPELTEGLGLDLDFRCASQGICHIRLTDRTRLEPDVELYLKDKQERKMLRMKPGDAYAFFHSPSDPPDRFKLYFNPDQDIIHNITPDTWYSVYAIGNTLIIIKNTALDLETEFFLYDMLGRPVHHQKIGNDATITLPVDVPTGNYIVSLVNSRHISNSKVFIGTP